MFGQETVLCEFAALRSLRSKSFSGSIFMSLKSYRLKNSHVLFWFFGKSRVTPPTVRDGRCVFLKFIFSFQSGWCCVESADEGEGLRDFLSIKKIPRKWGVLERKIEKCECLPLGFRSGKVINLSLPCGALEGNICCCFYAAPQGSAQSDSFSPPDLSERSHLNGSGTISAENIGVRKVHRIQLASGSCKILDQLAGWGAGIRNPFLMVMNCGWNDPGHWNKRQASRRSGCNREERRAVVSI